MAEAAAISTSGCEATRVCKKCGCEKALSDFGAKRDSGKVHVAWSCRKCTNKEQNRRNAKTSEQRIRQSYRQRNASLLEHGQRECKDCEQVLDLNQFRKKGIGIACRCYPCQAAKVRQQYDENHNGIRERMQEHGRKHRQIHGAQLNERKRIYVAANRQKVTDRQNEWAKAKVKVDPLFAMKKRLRSLMSNSFRWAGSAKNAETEAILGCTFEQFKAHIEKQFTAGMTWENRAKWHLDHVVPLATAKTQEDVVRLNHFTNYRPLWATDNISKGARIISLL
jgi:ssDNA-binding Zn-finger/Zn-ribbon topoisomerase 1